MRQIHNAPQPEDKLKKELEEAGLVSGNVDWLMKYLDDKTPEDPALLEKAVHQAPRSFNQQQALNFAPAPDSAHWPGGGVGSEGGLLERRP